MIREKQPTPHPLINNLDRMKLALDRVHIAFQMDDPKKLWLFGKQAYRAGKQILDIVSEDITAYALLHNSLTDVKKNDPEMYQRVIIVLHEAQDARVQKAKRVIPRQRTREIDVYRYQDAELVGVR